MYFAGSKLSSVASYIFIIFTVLSLLKIVFFKPDPLFIYNLFHSKKVLFYGNYVYILFLFRFSRDLNLQKLGPASQDFIFTHFRYFKF